MTFEDFLIDMRVKAKEQNKDFAWVAFRHTGDGQAAEVKIIWIVPPGGFPKEFPPVASATQKGEGWEWDTAWKIERCGIQPRPTHITVKAGKFLPGGMPNIEFD